MRNRHHFLLIALITGIAILPSCTGGGSSNPPNRGFDLFPDRIEISQTTGSQVHRPAVMRVISTFLEPQGTTQGTIEFFPETEIGPGFQNFFNARVPGKWRFQYREVALPGRIPCVGGIHTVERNVHVGETETLYCEAPSFPITLAPNAVNADSPPSTIQIEAEGASDTYGAPQVAILDEFGNLRASVTTTVLNIGKGQLEFTLPNMSAYSNGVYQITINNIDSSGRWDVVGAGELSVYGNTPPSQPSPPNPCSIPTPCLF